MQTDFKAATTMDIPPKRSYRSERYSRRLLYAVFYYGRFLNVINCYWDRQRKLVFPSGKCFKLSATLFRIIIVIAYWDVIPRLVLDFINKPRSFLQLFSSLQILSVAIFSIGLFWMKARDDAKLIELMNHFLKIIKAIISLRDNNFAICKNFIALYLLKGLITLLGYINEMPNLLSVEAFSLYHGFTVVVGTYLWLGSMYVLDVCYMGFLVLALMYCNLGQHLRQMMAKMQNIEAGSLMGSSYTPYHRMKLLCEYSEELDRIDRIYSRLYRVTKEFLRIFQYNILYYLYYNFMVIFLLLNHSIWKYIREGFIDFLEIFFILLKISNLTLMIVAASRIVEKSEYYNQLNLDVVCSDIDVRWDTSVETFLSQRKVENLEIKVLGFFSLNNEFILLMLSAIITYLFFIIQFGMTGGFGANA